MKVVVGVDGGGTKTDAVVADTTGAFLGLGRGGPSNWEDVGLGGAGAAFRVATGEALSAAGATPEDVAHSVFGLAGVDWPGDVDRLAFAIDPLGLAGGRSVVNDSEIVRRAGTDSRAAVTVVAGGGSVVAGRNARGETFRTVGLGRCSATSAVRSTSPRRRSAPSRAPTSVAARRRRSRRRCAGGSNARRRWTCSSTSPAGSSTAGSRTRSRASRRS
jgi:hypothetical protein